MRNPLCVSCMAVDRVTSATVVDHIEPHQGDSSLFWSRSNWQALCKLHHDQKTYSESMAKKKGNLNEVG